MAERGAIEFNEFFQREFGRLKAKVKQRASVVDAENIYGNSRECYEEGMLAMFEMVRPLLEATWKISDHRLIDHVEPDDYTKVGCLTHIATDALDSFWRELLYQYNTGLNHIRFEEEKNRKPDEKEPWGPSNPAHTTAEAEHRLRDWASSGASIEIGPHEILGWTRDEYKDYVQDRTVPDGYEP